MIGNAAPLDSPAGGPQRERAMLQTRRNLDGAAPARRHPRLRPGLLPAIALAILSACSFGARGADPLADSWSPAVPVEAAPAQPVEWQPLPADELEALVAPVALYPDDLLAIVLPASTYPLQIVQAARLHEAGGATAADPNWDESVVALLNYPEVLSQLDQDLDWTWELGQAARYQERELLDAVERLRRVAHEAGNLRSDSRQTVTLEPDYVTIVPADPAALYVPRYRSDVIWRQHNVLYDYYPRPYPVYYYPYPPSHRLARQHFWGVTSVFSIGWRTRHLHLHALQHRSHPYFGRTYYQDHYRYWYPRLAPGRYFRDYHGARHHAGNRWHSNWRHQLDSRPHPAVTSSRTWATGTRSRDTRATGTGQRSGYQPPRQSNQQRAVRNPAEPRSASVPRGSHTPASQRRLGDAAGNPRPPAAAVTAPPRLIDQPRSPRTVVPKPASTRQRAAAERITAERTPSRREAAAARPRPGAEARGYARPTDQRRVPR